MQEQPVSTAQNLLLHALRFGHEYPGSNLNSRLTGREDEIKELAASIKAEGLLQSLLICPSPKAGGVFYVIAGNRRLAALKKLAKDGAIDEKTFNVPVVVAGDITPADALRKSLAENEHVPLHPVDRFEVFAKVHEKGSSPAEIAARYAVAERVVKQSLALGRLAPVVREAWRAGKIDADSAQAFTFGKDHKSQEAVFSRLKKSGNMWDYSIRREFVGDQREAAALLKFVGAEAYKKAGGAVIEDLFGDENSVSDFPLIKKLAAEKVQAKCEDLVKAGWAWADTSEKLSSHARYYWEKIQTYGKAASAEAKKKAGCIVDQNNGQFDIVYGVVKPGTKGAKKADGKKAKPTGQLSKALIYRLSEQLTLAAKASLHTDIDVAISVLLASFLSANSPIMVALRSFQVDVKPDEDFEDILPRILKMPRQKKLEGLAKISSEAINMISHRDLPLDSEANVALYKVLPKVFEKNLLVKFDAQDFFTSAPKALVLETIAEACGKDAVKPLINKKHAEIADFAVKHVKNWLPKELRLAAKKK